MVKKYLANTWNAAMKLNKRNILELIEEYPNQKILDLGCDDGSWTLEISKKAKSKKLYGIDIVTERLNKAKKNGIKTKRGDLNNRWPYPNNYFDLVHSNQVIEHLWDIDLFAKETKRILKKGGYSIVSTENLSSWVNIASLILGWQPFSITNISFNHGGLGNPFSFYRHKKPKLNSWTHTRVMAITALKELFENYGFTVEKTYGSGYFPLPAIMGRIDSVHSHFITIKIRKK